MKIGLLSDTHNFLDPRIAELFRDVDHILHAGDVGLPWVLLHLEQFAPVTAVLGNTDSGMPLRETEVCTVGERTFLIEHIVDPGSLTRGQRQRIARFRPDIVVFGHTHKAFEQQVGNTLFINPGYAGKPKFAQPRTVALLHMSQTDVALELIPL